jgi:5-methylthioadenosine/S-adenosylhomocysteine deaminase
VTDPAHRLLIKGGRVYDHDGDVHMPAIADILIEGDRIKAIGPDLEQQAGPQAERLDATGRMVVPGMFNAHYHSHDTLCRGLFEELPLEIWLMYVMPMGADRPKEEVRLRTLVGALESLRCGITCVQDMVGLVPLNDEYLEVVLAAYEEIGIRVVFSPMVSDIPATAMTRYSDEFPPEIRALLGDKALMRQEQLDFLTSAMRGHPAKDTLHWAVAPFAPQRCSPELMIACAELAEANDISFYTHVYETRAQKVIAKDLFTDHGGSFIQYFKDIGVLGPRLNIAHSVWIGREEMDMMAEADAGVVLNHVCNLKLKNGIAPVCDLREAGVRIALGCDNCSTSDVQSMFQSMKLYSLFSAGSDPEPGPPAAEAALRHATLGSARTAGLNGVIGALKPGYKADMSIIDLRDTAYLPFNSAARQLVYTESGRGIETVIVDGNPVIRDRKAMTVDEDALRREVEAIMPRFLKDYAAVRESREAALPFMLDAHRRVWARDLGYSRFINRTPYLNQ